MLEKNLLLCKKIYWNLILEYTWNTGARRQHPSAFWLKLVYSYVIEVADFEYQLHLHHKALVLKIHVFAWIKVTITIENYSIYLLFLGITYKTPNTLNTFNILNIHNTLKTLDTLNTLKPLNTLKTFLTKVYTTTTSRST